MESDAVDTSGDELEKPSSVRKTKKRPRHGRLTDVNKKLLATTHETGPDCNCSMFGCFKVINSAERITIIKVFNSLGNWNDQSAHLTSLISVTLVVRRRPRHDDPKSRDCNFRYMVRVKRNDKMQEIPVCKKAFISLHGIGRRRLETVQSAIKEKGQAPKDRRGHHLNKHPCHLSDEKKNAVYDHINSFRGTRSHYGLNKTDKIYLPEELSIKKCHELYKIKYPNLHVSYESYREILINKKFNLSFGYPRTDTCSICDKFNAEFKILNLRHAEATGKDQKNTIQKEITALSNENNLHKLKAVTFYTRKRKARSQSKVLANKECICMDYQKNLPIPNITSNDVYYKRQLSFYNFNIHQLSNRDAIFYTYDETLGKKGANEVISFLDNYVNEVLTRNIRDLEIFCDSCSGQNKNYPLFLYLYYLVHNIKRFDKILITFPIRGHSYLECDKNISLVNKKSTVETPEEWNNVFRAARSNPSPFKVIAVQQHMIRDWTTFLKEQYKEKCPFATRPIREAKMLKDETKLFYRPTYNGPWFSSDIRRPPASITLQPGEFLYPDQAYQALLPISKEKYDDVQVLKQFCGEKAREFFTTLPYIDGKKEKEKNKNDQKKKKKV